MLWLLFAFTVISASAVLWLSVGPLKGTPQVPAFQIIAAVQFLAALLLLWVRFRAAA